MFSLWDKVIYAIFCIPLAMVLGPVICWCLSHYFVGIKGIGIYLLSILITLVFTTVMSFVFPNVVSKILTALV